MLLHPQRRYSNARKHFRDNGKLCTIQSDAIETRLRNVTEVTLRQGTVMMWRRWRRDDANDWTLSSRSVHNNNVRLQQQEDWWFSLRLPLALVHHRYFDLKTCRPAADDSLRLVSRRNWRSSSKDDCWFPSRLLLALYHSQCFDPLLCRHEVDERIRLASRQTPRPESKLSWGVYRAMDFLLIQELSYIVWIFILVYSSSIDLGISI